MQSHPIWKIVFMLVLTYALLAIYSFSKRPIKIGKVELVQSEIKDYFSRTSPPTGQPATASDSLKMRDTSQHTLGASTPLNPAPNKTPRTASLQLPELSTAREALDTTKQRILLIGDSMLEGLMLRLKDYTEANHHDMKPVIWYGSSTKVFGTHDTLAYFIRQFKPTFIWICLGGNELFVRGIKKEREPYMKNILRQIGKCRFIWIGPPNWKEDTGINDLIVSNVGELRYFPSKNLKFQRAKDGAHPTHASASVWLDSIASWVVHKSMYPIKLDKPSSKTKKTPGATLLMPKYD